MNAAFQVEHFKAGVRDFGSSLEVAVGRLHELRTQVEHDGGMREEDALGFIDAVACALDFATDSINEARNEAREAALESEDVAELEDIEGEAKDLAESVRAIINRIAQRATEATAPKTEAA